MDLDNKKLFIHASSGGLGDVLMLLPGLMKIINNYDVSVKLTLSYPALIEVFRYFLGENSSRVTFDILAAEEKNTKFIKYFLSQRSEVFDYAFFPMSFSSTKSLIALAAIGPRKLYESGRVLLRKSNDEEHKTIYYAKRMDTSLSKLEIKKVQKRLARLAEKLSSNFSIEKPAKYVVVAPGSSELEKHKRWPIDKIVDLVVRLKVERGVDTVLLGGKLEKSLMLEINYRCEMQSVSCSIQQSSSILASVSLINKAEALVSGCCSAIHMASLTNTRIVGLYGPTSFKFTGPWNDNFEIVELPLSCRPCYPKLISGCGNAICMHDLQASSVLFALNIPASVTDRES